MTADRDLKTKLRIHTAEFLVKARDVRVALQGIGIAAPLLVGLLKVVLSPHAPLEWVAINGALQVVFLLVGAVCGLLVLLTDKSALGVMIDAQAIAEDAEGLRQKLASAELVSQQLEVELGRSARLGLTIDSMRVAVDVALSPNAPSSKEQSINELLDLLVASKQTLFNMGDEQWNFSVYLWNEEAEELECVACRRPARVDEDAVHRKWKPGEGHIGKAFQMERALICADSKEVNVRGFFDAPITKQAAYDDTDRYRSLAAIPIQLPGAPRPVGVVVATSDQPNRFEPTREGDDSEAVRPIRALSKTLATFLAVTNLTVQRDD